MHLALPLRLALTLAATLAAPAAAHADATATMPTPSVVLVESTADEANEISVERDADVFVVRDAAAGRAIVAAGPCVQDAAAARCPAAGVSVVRVRTGPGDDRVQRSGDATPRELVGGTGVDWLVGGSGPDRLDQEDGTADAHSSCGGGEDQLVDDPVDPSGDCDVVAPYVTGSVELRGDHRVGFPLYATPPIIETTGAASRPDIGFAWSRCAPAGDACEVVRRTTGELSYQLGMADLGHTIRLTATARNAAGERSLTSAATPVIAPPPPMLLPPPGTYVDPFGRPIGPPAPDRGTEAGPGPAQVALDTGLRVAARKLRGTDLRRLAGTRAARVQLLLPVAGTLELRFTVPATVARRHGARVAGARPVTLASGVAQGEQGKLATVDVRTTPVGRTVLRRAKRLTFTLVAKLDPLAAGPPVRSTRPVALQRKARRPQR